MDGWPPISTERFDGESRESYQRRAARITEIVTVFRSGNYDSEAADDLERELIELQEPAWEDA